MYSTKNKKQGFTLIELLVVTVIILILSTILVIPLYTQRSAVNVETETDKLIANLRLFQAQGMAGAVKPTAPTENAGLNAFLNKTGKESVGINVNTQRTVDPVIMFKDTNKNFKYDGASELLYPVNLKTGIDFYEIRVCSQSTWWANEVGGCSKVYSSKNTGDHLVELTVVFVPPSPNPIISVKFSNRGFYHHIAMLEARDYMLPASYADIIFADLHVKKSGVRIASNGSIGKSYEEFSY